MLFNLPYTIYYAPEGNKGGGGEAGQEAEKKKVNPLQEVRGSIADAVKSTEPDKKSQKRIPYFEEEPSGEGEEGEGGDEGEPAGEGKTEPSKKKKWMDPLDDHDDDEGEEGEGEEGEEGEPAGKKTGEGAADDDDIPDEKKDYYYLPVRDAKGKDVYPNEFKDRQSAEYGIAAKIDQFDQEDQELQENGSSADQAIPAQIIDKIESLRDVTQLSNLDDEQVRETIVDLDMALKAVKVKSDRVKQKTKASQKITQAEDKVQQIKPKASKASREIGLAERITAEQPENFTQILSMADEQINSIMEPLATSVKNHENDKEFIEENGHEQWVSKLRELEDQRDQKKQELQGYRQDIVAYNEAIMESESAKTQHKEPTNAEVLKMADEKFVEWQDNRSEGPFALDIFKAPTTDPIVHLRKFAYSPANFKKYDLTSMKGWDQAHSDWKADQKARFEQEQAKQTQQKSNEKRKSKIKEPIQDPDQGNQIKAPKGSPHTEISKLQGDILRQAKEVGKHFGG